MGATLASAPMTRAPRAAAPSAADPVMRPRLVIADCDEFTTEWFVDVSGEVFLLNAVSSRYLRVGRSAPMPPARAVLSATSFAWAIARS
jgi:hypothetical protein